MKIISFMCKKGGPGKSTIASMLALYWAEQEGKHVAIIDRDRNKDSLAFVRAAQHPNIHIFENGEAYDYVLVDTPGGIQQKDVDTIMQESNLVLVPSRLRSRDIRNATATARLIRTPEKARLVWNCIDTTTAMFRHRGQYAKAIGLTPLKSYLVDRVSYDYASTGGWEMLDRKALTELAKLAKEVR